MGYSRVQIITDPLDGELLIAEGETRKGGAYIARITGTDPKYKYAREFLGKKKYEGRKRDFTCVSVPLTDLRTPWDLLEIRAGGSWKNDYRDFYIYNAVEKTINGIDEKALREKLAELVKPAAVTNSSTTIERRVQV